MQQFFCNADDYGLSKAATDSINKCIAEDKVDGVSLLCGGMDVANAVKCLAERMRHPKKDIAVAVHLNLFDGKCCAQKELIPALVNKDGFFYLNLVSLWWLVIFSRNKADIKKQIFVEFCAQIDFFILHFPKAPIRLDGHQHIHAMPAFLPIMEKIINKYQVSYVRTPIENNYKFNAPILKKLKGLLRRYLLRKWGEGLKSLLRKHGVKTADYFIGSALSCNMTYEYLDYVYKQIVGKEGLVEVMLHPYFPNEFELLFSQKYEDLIRKLK